MNFSRLQAVYNSFGMKILDVKVGQLLEIHEVIGEGDNKRNWKFKCLVLSVRNPQHPTGTFLVRGISSGIVIEKIYPLCFDKFSKVILLDESKTRRAKLYYTRDKVGKLKLKSVITPERRNMDLLTLQVIPTGEVVSDTNIGMEMVDNKMNDTVSSHDEVAVATEEVNETAAVDSKNIDQAETETTKEENTDNEE